MCIRDRYQRRVRGELMIRVTFIGAGQVNFGSALKEKWDHASRLERLSYVKPVAIIDPFLSQAKAVLEERQKKLPTFWADTKLFQSLPEFLDSKIQTDCVFIGVPPFAHGSLISDNLETLCASHGIHLFIEKPISSIPPQKLMPIRDSLVGYSEIVISVAYMFRYSLPVLKIKQILEKHKAAISAVHLRYNCSYESITKSFWWDKTCSGGPIVEQATHFCDLARFLCGEVDLSSIKATTIPHDHRLGKLESMKIDEDKIPKENRVPRVTTCFWKFENGALGTLTHGLLLRGASYDTSIEIWADGLCIRLEDPYDTCKLIVRDPDHQTPVIEDLSWEKTQDDPYFNEDVAFLDAIKTKNKSGIRSDFADAFKTYELTWAIREASERSDK
eukprot:TRINITY_DN2617_c0_g2_i1.p1 TRINITY_DN2617_c0_g2~~TRINITY_DN2617_c0_g2_i1.p1  ORF type:complete len:388 (+),score=69.69 TRINITY_DN2617_c0_g2_i1:3-1166(+)